MKRVMMAHPDPHEEPVDPVQLALFVIGVFAIVFVLALSGTPPSG